MALNICSYNCPSSSSVDLIIRNLDVVSLDADNITCDTLTVAGTDPLAEINALDNRLILVEDKTANMTRSGAVTEFSGSIKANAITAITTPEVTISPSLQTSGNITTTGLLTASSNMNIGNTLYVNSSTNRVGINNPSPSYPLDITGTCSMSGDYYMSGNFYGNTIRTPAGPVTVSGNSTTFSFPDTTIKRFVIGFAGFNFISTGAIGSNNMMINLMAGATTVGTGYAGGLYVMAATNSTTSATGGCYVGNSSTSVNSGDYWGHIIWTYLGSNLWSWDGAAFKALAANQAITFTGVVDVGASAITGVKLSMSSSLVTYSAFTSVTLAGKVGIVYQS